MGQLRFDKTIQAEIYNIVDLDNLGTKNYTTKGRGHGLGIFSVLRNNEVSVKFQIIDNIFVSNLYAKKNES